jgi:excisionase family DNA binding protein
MSNTLLAGSIREFSVSEPEQRLAMRSSRSLAEFLPGETEPITIRLVDPHGGAELVATIPAAAVRVLTQALAEMAEGRPVTLVPLQAELSTQQAAELLGVSRPYFVKLLEQEQIPYRKVGEQRRVRYEDLRRYLSAYEQAGVAAASQMVAEAQELGLYE